MPVNPPQLVNLTQPLPIPSTTVWQGAVNIGAVAGITTSTWNPRSGGQSKQIFEGTLPQIVLIAQQSQVLGYEYSIIGGGSPKIEVNFPFDIILNPDGNEPNPIVIWEMINTPWEKDILFAGDRPFNSSLSIATMNTIRSALKANTNTQPPPFSAGSVLNTNQKVNAQIVFNLKSVGVHARQSSLQTLRLSMIVSNYYNFVSNPLLQPQYDYQIFNSNNLRNTYSYVTNNDLNNIPLVIKDAMPSSLTVQTWVPNTYGPLATTTTTNVGGDNGNSWNIDNKGIVTYVGWLQFPTEYQMISINKVQLSTHWVFNQWSAGPWGLYDIAIDTTPSPNPQTVLQY